MRAGALAAPTGGLPCRPPARCRVSRRSWRELRERGLRRQGAHRRAPASRAATPARRPCSPPCSRIARLSAPAISASSSIDRRPTKRSVLRPHRSRSTLKPAGVGAAPTPRQDRHQQRPAARAEARRSRASRCPTPTPPCPARRGRGRCCGRSTTPTRALLRSACTTRDAMPAVKTEIANRPGAGRARRPGRQARAWPPSRCSRTLGRTCATASPHCSRRRRTARSPSPTRRCRRRRPTRRDRSTRRAFYCGIETLFFGLSLGSRARARRASAWPLRSA